MVGVGGVLPSPQGYWEAILPVLEKHDVLLVSDEVVTGFGRLGTLFGADLYGYEPDMMTISKGLTSGYFPLAGSVVGEKVWAILEEGSTKYGPFSHGFTYAAHPLGAAVALTNLDIIEREGLMENAARQGALLRRRLAETFGGHEMVGDVRGEGLLACVEFVGTKAERRLFDPGTRRRPAAGRGVPRRRLLLRPLPDGDMLGFSPPLIVTEADVEEMIARMKRAVDREVDAMIAEGAWRPARS